MRSTSGLSHICTSMSGAHQGAQLHTNIGTHRKKLSWDKHDSLF
jgi:hypothetical protein